MFSRSKICKSPESGGAGDSPDPEQGSEQLPEKPASSPRAAYPVKAPEGRITRRAEPVLPQRRMPGTDKQTTGEAKAPAPQAPAAAAPEAKAAPVAAVVKESHTAAKEAAKLAARQAAREALAKDDIATRPTEQLTREAIAARKAGTAKAVDAEREGSGPLQPFTRGIKASEAPTMPPHRAPTAKPVQQIPKPPTAGINPAAPAQAPRPQAAAVPPVPVAAKPAAPAKAPMVIPKSDAFPPAKPALPAVNFAGEETEVRGNIEPVGGPPMSSAPVSPLEETQDMDPAEVEKPAVVEGESPRISFGQAALMLKLVSPAQIQECVNIQRMQMSKGQRVSLLGQILQERGYLDKTGIDKIKSYQQVYQFGNKIPGYQIVEKLGQGAMGAVFKAKQTRMERWVAIKILQPELAANVTIKQRFLQEARASARLNHPNVIVGIDAGEIAGLSYFAMEYVEGKTMAQLIKERGPMDERQALEIIVQVARALEHAEKHSLVHRDIKPDNIMVTRERVAKLLDLGLAKMRAEGDEGTAKGMAVGTPNYISPEQAMGRSDIDTRADIYSLGVTLFYVLTARVPFEGPPEVVMYRHIHEPPPHPKNFRPDLSDSVCTLMFTMMSKRPEDRPASAGQVVSDMEHLLRTGKLPGLFDAKPGGAAPLRVNKGGGALVVKKRLPNLHGYGMPGQHAPAPQSQDEDDPNAPVMPRKRRKRFGNSW